MMKVKKIRGLILIVILCVFYTLKTFCQNLIPNPGFEEMIECPKDGWIELHLCEGWSSPAGTADYFNICMNSNTEIKGKKTVTINKLEQAPNDGNGFVGFFLFTNNNFYDREYIQSKLIEPLQRGEQYTITFFISKRNISEIDSDHISICFSKTGSLERKIMDVKNPEDLDLLGNHYVTLSCIEKITFSHKKTLKNKEWTLVKLDYIAKGGEEYITIGSFLEDRRKQHFKRTSKNNKKRNLQVQYAYYFIDDISVVPKNARKDYTHEYK